MQFLQELKGTGRTRALVRKGYAEVDDFGFGFVAGAYGGIDAPLQTPTGASTALSPKGTRAYAAKMADTNTSHVCRFRHCVCGGGGNVTHVCDAE